MEMIQPFHCDTLIVICASYASHKLASALAAELTLRAPLTLLDGGNRFQSYLVARLLRQQTVDGNRAAKRMFLRCAFLAEQFCTRAERVLVADTPAPKIYQLLLFAF